MVGTLLTGFVDSLLHEREAFVGMQVVKLTAIRIEEGIGLSPHGLGCADTHEGDALPAILLNDVARIHGRGVAILGEVDADHIGLDLWQQLQHAGHAVVELVVAQGDGIVAHVLHEVDDVLAVGDGSRQVTLQEVASAHHRHEACVATHDGVAQALHLGIAVDAAVYIVLVKDDDRLLEVGVRTVTVVFATGYCHDASQQHSGISINLQVFMCF